MPQIGLTSTLFPLFLLVYTKLSIYSLSLASEGPLTFNIPSDWTPQHPFWAPPQHGLAWTDAHRPLSGHFPCICSQTLSDFTVLHKTHALALKLASDPQYSLRPQIGLRDTFWAPPQRFVAFCPPRTPDVRGADALCLRGRSHACVLRRGDPTFLPAKRLLTPCSCALPSMPTIQISCTLRANTVHTVLLLPTPHTPRTIYQCVSTHSPLTFTSRACLRGHSNPWFAASCWPFWPFLAQLLRLGSPCEPTSLGGSFPLQLARLRLAHHVSLPPFPRLLPCASHRVGKLGKGTMGEGGKGEKGDQSGQGWGGGEGNGDPGAGGRSTQRKGDAGSQDEQDGGAGGERAKRSCKPLIAMIPKTVTTREGESRPVGILF